MSIADSTNDSINACSQCPDFTLPHCMLYITVNIRDQEVHQGRPHRPDATARQGQALLHRVLRWPAHAPDQQRSPTAGPLAAPRR